MAVILELIKPVKCPKCGTSNADNWPLEIDGEIKDGGCQECWEQACDESWWEALRIIQTTAEGGG